MSPDEKDGKKTCGDYPKTKKKLAAFVLSLTISSCSRSRDMQVQRRRVLHGLAGTALAVQFSSLSDQKAAAWNTSDLCGACGGRGLQECSFCAGVGVLTLGDALVEVEETCPNCEGRGTISCPRCIGLGLRDVRGILRDGK